MRSIWHSLFLGNRSLPPEFNNVRSNLTYVNSTQAIFELTWMWLGMWCVGHYQRVLAIFGVNLSTTIVLKTHNMSPIYYNNKNLGYVITTTSMIDLDEIFGWNTTLMFSLSFYLPMKFWWSWAMCGKWLTYNAMSRNGKFMKCIVGCYKDWVFVSRTILNVFFLSRRHVVTLF